jgi:methionyl aminopeptidase
MILIKTSEEIAIMRQSGKILAGVMEAVGQAIAPDVNTQTLDDLAEKLILENKGEPIFKGQGESDNPFPATICASLNDEIVHGIPSENKIIHEGDLVKIDMGVKYQGMVTDMARTFEVGTVSPLAHKLVATTREALDAGIKKIKAGASLNEYGLAVEEYAHKRGFSVVRELTGHGVGRELHEDPAITNYQSAENDLILKEGMTIALEPMINEGTWRIKLARDNWAFLTKDGKLSAHFEDTLAVTKNGYEIMTR